MHRWNIDNLQLRMSLADVYYQISASVELLSLDGADLTLDTDQIRWQGMYGLQT